MRYRGAPPSLFFLGYILGCSSSRKCWEARLYGHNYSLVKMPIRLALSATRPIPMSRSRKYALFKSEEDGLLRKAIPEVDRLNRNVAGHRYSYEYFGNFRQAHQSFPSGVLAMGPASTIYFLSTPWCSCPAPSLGRKLA